MRQYMAVRTWRKNSVLVNRIWHIFALQMATLLLCLKCHWLHCTKYICIDIKWKTLYPFSPPKSHMPKRSWNVSSSFNTVLASSRWPYIHRHHTCFAFQTTVATFTQEGKRDGRHCKRRAACLFGFFCAETNTDLTCNLLDLRGTFGIRVVEGGGGALLLSWLKEKHFWH